MAYSAPPDPLAGFKAEWKGRERRKGGEMRGKRDGKEGKRRSRNGERGK